jgi:hypothetical protein
MLPIVTGTIGLAVAVFIILLIRKDRLHVRHGLSWIVVAFSFAVFGVFPGIVDGLAKLTGVSYPPILGVTVAIAILVIKILLMDLERSRLEIRNQRLIQRVAMLEADINALRQEKDNAANSLQSDTARADPPLQ